MAKICIHQCKPSGIFTCFQSFLAVTAKKLSMFILQINAFGL
jgi:hypothetical protein